MKKTEKPSFLFIYEEKMNKIFEKIVSNARKCPDMSLLYQN
jgi:hypothetical protein